MTIGARQTQGQRQTLGFRQLQAISLLRLTNEALAEDLARRAADNPLIRLRLPAGAAPPPGHDDPAGAEDGLYPHVLPQVPLIVTAPRDQALALAFVEALDGNGWLDRPVADIAAAAGRPLREAEALLARLQQGIEPTGLFARDLADCLRLQAAERGLLTPALQALLHHLPLLAERGPAGVARATGLPEAALHAAALGLRRLDPRPGLAFGGSPAPLRAPDVIVTRAGEGWKVELNRATLPALTILPGDDPALRPARAEAEWLARVVERRNRTVLAVARAVMRRQTGYLDRGALGLVPLTRLAVAAELGLHDSTVGRVARDLLVETPHGLRSLCSFFDSGPGGGAAASAAIRARLLQLIAAEQPAAPHSDADLAALLTAEGMAAARRTVARFREELRIPPRHARRRPG